jgi:hypothetical protein
MEGFFSKIQYAHCFYSTGCEAAVTSEHAGDSTTLYATSIETSGGFSAEDACPKTRLDRGG